LSRRYVATSEKLRWRCSAGHEFRIAPMDLKRNVSFCPECRPRKPGTLAEMRAIATGRGGECLSRAYVNALIHLEWICKEGHRWRATPASVKRGSWCAICSRVTATSMRGARA